MTKGVDDDILCIYY